MISAKMRHENNPCVNEVSFGNLNPFNLETRERDEKEEEKSQQYGEGFCAGGV